MKIINRTLPYSMYIHGKRIYFRSTSICRSEMYNCHVNSSMTSGKSHFYVNSMTRFFWGDWFNFTSFSIYAGTVFCENLFLNLNFQSRPSYIRCFILFEKEIRKTSEQQYQGYKLQSLAYHISHFKSSNSTNCVCRQ